MTIGNPISNPENWLSRELANLLLREAWNHNPRNWLIMFILLRSGRRIGELLELKAKDIDFQGGMIIWNIEKKYKFIKDKYGEMETYTDKKGKSKLKTNKTIWRRWKAIDPESLQFLKNYIGEYEIKPDEYLFYSPHNGRHKHISRVMVWKFITRYGQNIGIKVHPHTFRHTFSVWIAKEMQSPADLVKLKTHLEHSDTKITEAYLQFSTKDTKDLLNRTFIQKKT